MSERSTNFMAIEARLEDNMISGTVATVVRSDACEAAPSISRRGNDFAEEEAEEESEDVGNAFFWSVVGPVVLVVGTELLEAEIRVLD